MKTFNPSSSAAFDLHHFSGIVEESGKKTWKPESAEAAAAGLLTRYWGHSTDIHYIKNCNPRSAFSDE